MTEATKTIEIRICMGSSCFSRGNSETLAVIRDYIERNGLADRVNLVGSLCEGRCKEGPNIVVDGVRYEQVDRSTVVDIIEYHVRESAGD